MMNNKAPKNQSGMSLIELMVATGMLGIVIGTATTYYGSMSRQSNLEHLKDLQLKLASDVEAAVTTPDAIIRTANAPGNSLLKNCITPGVGCGTTEPPGAELVLYNADSPPAKIASSTTNYDFDGNICSGSSPKCIFNPRVSFWATCPLGSNNKPQKTCTNPVFLNFKYQIDNIHPEKNKRFKQIDTYPEKGNISSTTLRRVIRMRVSDALLRIGDSCEAGEMLTGFDINGKAICDCIVQSATWNSGQGKMIPNFDSAGNPICGQQACPKDSLMTGYRLDVQTVKGKQRKTIVPECKTEKVCSQNPVPSGCPCKIVNLNAQGDCGPGFWMVSITHGVCEGTTEKNGKDAPETVKCSEREGRCCSFEQQ
jgi:hypothetical protein